MQILVKLIFDILVIGIIFLITVFIHKIAIESESIIVSIIAWAIIAVIGWFAGKYLLREMWTAFKFW